MFVTPRFLHACEGRAAGALIFRGEELPFVSSPFGTRLSFFFGEILGVFAHLPNTAHVYYLSPDSLLQKRLLFLEYTKRAEFPSQRFFVVKTSYIPSTYVRNSCVI